MSILELTIEQTDEVLSVAKIELEGEQREIRFFSSLLDVVGDNLLEALTADFYFKEGRVDDAVGVLVPLAEGEITPIDDVVEYEGKQFTIKTVEDTRNWAQRFIDSYNKQAASQRG